jgi:hypothetical protein
MKVNYNKITELSESYINGNKGYVRDKVKRLNKVEFVLLCSDIHNRKDNYDLDEIAFSLTLGD